MINPKAKYSLKVVVAFFATVLCLNMACKKSSTNDPTQERNKENKELGETFLKENRSKNGVMETYTGLQYVADTVGKGIKPDLNDSVYMRFDGYLADGTQFTSSTTGMLVEDQIKGMQEGLQMMAEGSVFEFFIPYYLAYGNNSHTVYFNGKIVISPYSMLHFRVKLNKVVAISAEG